MSGSPQHFQYAPLLGLRSTRILLLKPARKVNSPIQFSLREISLEDDSGLRLRYEALSYTWGALRGTQAIFCEDRTLLVTPNCEQALLHLRQKTKTRNLWVDAICIDQQSALEKNHQVPMMGEIYRCAIRSIIWLGPATDASLLVVLRRATRYGNALNALRALKKLRKSDDQLFESWWELGVLSAAESDRIAALCKNDWFGRLWTIQEFLLSKSAIFLMGNVECPTLALYTYYHLGKGLVRRPDLEHYRIRNTLSTFRPSPIGDHMFKMFMVIIIELAALNSTTDARDKVYGMVAYLKTKWPDFQLPVVDYTTSVANVYETFTRVLINTTKSFWPLELSMEPSGADSNDLPSWVLDLRNPNRLAPGWEFRRNQSLLSEKPY